MILLAGATGYLGGKVAAMLLERGDPLRVLVRPGSSYAPLVELGAEAVEGDLKDRVSIEAAVRGARVVVTTANSAARGGDDTPETVDLLGNRNLVEAAVSAGVERFVFVSAYGVAPDSPVPFFRAKAETERRVRDSGIPHVILAPDLFMEVWVPMVVGNAINEKRPVTLVGAARRRHSFISIEDVAGFVVAATHDDSTTHQHLPLGGPEALSWRDVVGTYERVLDRRIEVSTVQPGEPVPGLPEVVAGIMAGLETYDSVIDAAPLARRLGIAQTPLEAVVRNQLVGA